MDFILTLAIFSGQIIKLPLTVNSGITVLDLVVIFLCVWGSVEIKLKLKKPPLPFLFFIAFSFIGTISFLFSPLNLSLNEIFLSFSYTIRFLLYLYLGWILYSGGLKSVREKFYTILKTSGLLLSIGGLLQLLFIPNLIFLTPQGWDPHYFRTVSTFLDPNFLGGFLSLVLLLILSEFEKTKKDKKLLITFLVCFLALVTTFSRSATICFLSGSIFLAFFNKSKRLFLMTILFSLVFGIAFLGYRQFISAPRNIDRGASASYRLNTYDEGLQVFHHSPVSGVGFNSYRFALSKYHLASISVINSHGGSTNDSSLLYILATTGIVGFVFYILGALFLLKSSSSTYFRSAFLAIIIQSFFINTLFYPWILLWIFLTWVRANDKSS